jgi:NodT family efflux transporter outer membrane factor (OMF) lipoprotein
MSEKAKSGMRNMTMPNPQFQVTSLNRQASTFLAASLQLVTCSLSLSLPNREKRVLGAGRMRFVPWLLGLISLLAGGCAMVGPDYEKVRPEVGENWTARMEKGLEAAGPERDVLAEWWKVLDDPVLTALEEKAVQGNLDLQTSLSRLRQARILRGISKSELYPTLNASGVIQEQRGSESLQAEFGGEEEEYYLAQFDSSWELDLFGGIRRSVEAARAEIEASQADVGDVLVSLMGEVAVNYIEVRTYQQRLDITWANIETQEKTYALNKSRHEAGLIDQLAVQQSLRNLETSRSQIPRLKSGLRAAKNRLAVLLGQAPGSVDELLAADKAIPQVPPRVAVGIPAEAMRRRPDIRRAERQLAAQTARIGVATAELYPKFRLLGTIGLEALESNFLDAQSRFWGIGPGVSWNIFQGGALRLNIDLQTERQKEALIFYKSTILQALQEVENTLTAYAKEQMREESLERAVAAARRTEFLARDRYNAGLTDFYNVLDAQRALLELEDELTLSRAEVASNLARLYKALGGGWEY